MCRKPEGIIEHVNHRKLPSLRDQCSFFKVLPVLAVSGVPVEAGASHWAPWVVARRLQSAGSVVVAVGLVALGHVGSSRIRDRTHVSCIGRWILDHWAPGTSTNALFNIPVFEFIWKHPTLTITLVAYNYEMYPNIDYSFP